MDLDTIRLFSKYNEATNRNMNAFIEKLTKEQWEHKFGGHFPSINRLCNHLYISDFNWLKRFSRLRSFDYIKKELFDKEVPFTALAVKSIRDYLEKRAALDSEISRFVGEITDTDLRQNLTYVDSHGNQHTRNFGGVVLHMFNHETHHRGMISVYLEELGIQNDYSNLMNIV